MWSDGQTTALASNLAGGNDYAVTTTDANGCTATDSVRITGVLEVSGNSLNIAIYPNPAREYVMLDMNAVSPADIQLYNLIGQPVISRTIVSQRVVLDVSVIPDGIYMLHVNTEKGVMTKRIIVR